MLQSEDSRPALFYSWGGGVMQAQVKAGFLKDITADVARRRAEPVADRGRGLQGRRQGLRRAVRHRRGAFFYNKKLFAKAGVKAEDIKTWDDFLGAVKKLKAAGITPIVVGAGEKWPMHFYYSYLVMRIGGDARAGRREGRQGRRLQERRPSSRPASACRNWPRSSRSSPAISPPRISNRLACSATARRRWI